MRNRSWWVLLLTGLVAVLVVSSCGADSAATRVIEEPGEAAAMAAATSPGSDAPDSLDDYLGVAAIAVRSGGGGIGPRALAAVDTDQLAQEQQLIQLEIQTCMRAQGFEYVPEEARGLRTFLRSAGDGLSAREYAETRGFGVSTIFDELFAGEVQLFDDEPGPNEVHVATLSDSEADAWLFALRGEPPLRDEQGRLIDPDTGEVIPGQGPGRATGGCQLDAQIAVRGDLSLLVDLSEAWDALEERIEADPRIAELDRAWATCMLDRGFDYRDPDDARADFEARFRPLLVSFVQRSGLAGAGSGVGQGNGRLGVLQDLADRGLTIEQEVELRSLQRREIEAAVATLDCAGDDQAEIDEIRARYEADFVAENRELLESFAG